MSQCEHVITAYQIGYDSIIHEGGKSQFIPCYCKECINAYRAGREQGRKDDVEVVPEGWEQRKGDE